MNSRNRPAGRVAAVAILLSGLAGPGQASDLRVGAGTLSVRGGSVSADRIEIGAPATLTGTGSVDAAAEVFGTIAPGAMPSSAGVLTVRSSVVFRAGSTLRARALAHEEVDRLAALGPISGTAGVELASSAGAIPIDQVVAAGAADSDYAGFAATGSGAANWALASRAPGSLLITDLVGDTDDDALPDWWEWRYFSSRISAAPDDDPDGDQFPNSAEYGAGTAPTNGASLLRMSDVASIGPDAVRLSWSSEAGRRYAILAKSSLSDATFTNVVTGILATAPENTYTSPAPADGARFYRIGVQP